MGDQYYQFLSSVSGLPPSSSSNNQDMSVHPLPRTQQFGSPMMNSPIPNPYQNLGYFTGFTDSIMFNTQKLQRSRRKQTSGIEHIKHRRTRSGCYTCRSRRVKCDETHPVCDRCRKGKRDCVYPEPTNTKQGSGHNAAKESATISQQTSPVSSHGEDDAEEGDPDTKLKPIPDEEELETPGHQESYSMAPPRRMSTASTLSAHKSMTRQSSEAPSIDETTTMASSPSASMLGLLDPLLSSPLIHDWSHLSFDLQQYLYYFNENISHYHYSVISDPDGFFRTILPAIALRSEPLLYAIAAFSSYHYAMNKSHGKLHDFLQYYNRSVTSLLESLKRKDKPSVATLLTILQLATIEEYLGDWVNLIGHQKAAFEVLIQLFTPLNITQTPISRATHSWYTRFDVFSSILGATEPTIRRDWLSTYADFCCSQVAGDPESFAWRVEECVAQMRLICWDMGVLFAKSDREEIDEYEFFTEHERIARWLEDWKSRWDPKMTNAAFLVTDLGQHKSLEQDDIVDPLASQNLFKGDLFATTLLTCQWHAISLLRRFHATKQMKDVLPINDLAEHAQAICQIFEAVQLWSSSPKGSLIVLQPCLTVASLFVPQDPRHFKWLKRKFAALERIGCVFSTTWRSHMADISHDPTCLRWWLPNDDGFTPLLQEIRVFADERNAAATATQPERIGEIRRVFAKLQLGGLTRSYKQS